MWRYDNGFEFFYVRVFDGDYQGGFGEQDFFQQIIYQDGYGLFFCLVFIEIYVIIFKDEVQVIKIINNK